MQKERDCVQQMYPGQSWKNKVAKMSANQVHAIFQTHQQKSNVPALQQKAKLEAHRLQTSSRKRELLIKLQSNLTYYEAVVILTEIRELGKVEQYGTGNY